MSIIPGQDDPISKQKYKQKAPAEDCKCLITNLWELRESNPRPSACKADALNQLS